MIYMTFQNENKTAIYPHLKFNIPRGLMARIPGFHPGGPGSIPGVGVPFLGFLGFSPNFKALFRALGELGRAEGHISLKLEVLKCP